jgi:hypothetical protein
LDYSRLTDDFFVGVSRKFLGRQKQRVAVESIHETARHPDRVRHALVASFCYLRRQEITDALRAEGMGLRQIGEREGLSAAGVLKIVRRRVIRRPPAEPPAPI